MIRHDLTHYALAAAARGWHVFPVTPNGKKPLRGFDDWQAHATTDSGRIAAIWRHAPYNVGIACGPSGLVVIDLDLPKPGEHPPADAIRDATHTGEQVFRLLCHRRGQPYPGDTLTVQTRRGGLHLYFTAPEGVRLGNTAGRRGTGLGWLIDTRAWGGQVVGPGSYVRLRDGTGTYRITHDVSPAPLPDWITQSLTPAPPPPVEATDVLAEVAAHRLSRYGDAALRAEAAEVADAPGGRRNYTLNRAAFNLGRLVARGILPADLVARTLTHAAEAANRQVTDRRPASPREIAATIAGGMSAGMKAPPTRRRTTSTPTPWRAA
ncbi:bifunctional DNA primase/polymerase [Nonomuraea typhae]|uniref:bifunctional DNA primase/polymerase n=1 Tax=Nonomuraea typhae TaxID=2603600 RepID=UPI001FE6CDED|nr:bifunctional DNA primase/polymerase [Nonomuraea typhae]